MKNGVTATDYEDEDLTASIVVSGEVNTSVAGQYKLIYSVTDNDGNTTTVTRIVTVKKDVKPEVPSIDSDKEDVSITPDNKVETENNESNSEGLPKTGAAVLASELSLLSSLLIFIGSLLSRRKTKK